ncbi:ricin-type beta-trefoil lectin domain protein [Amycolatopsis sp. NPDC051372]|uniref:ricin-type beta-trefoil lectin domain protein n=1 Tax=Amycolatopsis sp. NPDC051372 TaxID=3155669 RepID=UPI0034499AAB
MAKDKQGRVLLYVRGDNETALRAAVQAVGGTVSAAQPGQVRAAVDEAEVDALAKQPGVHAIQRPTKVLPSAITSEGVAASGADSWLQAGNKGAGVKIGILDVGFGGLADAQAAGELPTGTQLVTNGSNCLDATVDDDHGINVAEVVHDMAPDATLYLSCVQDTMGFAPAGDWLQQQGVQIISAAISVPGSGRGDGTGPDANSPAQVVERSRQAGILWSTAAGNYGQLHYSGQAADRSGANGWVEFSGTSEVNGFAVGSGLSATVTLRWDAWPVTTKDLDLYVTDQAVAPTGVNDPHVVARSTLSQRDTTGGAAPVEETTFTNTTGSAGSFYIWVKNNNAPFTTSFDLYVTKRGGGSLQWPTPAGSIAEPASSPYALAVGATKPASGQLELYSSRGPTVDGRIKPDLTGFDAVSTATYGTDGFTGTSAAAAHVAGAAALFKGANPQLDATQLEALLKSRAKPVAGGSPNDWGAGILAMGSPGSAPGAVPGAFNPLTTPAHILDTNTAVGGHQRRFTAGETFTLAIPGVPNNATAVVLTVTAGLADGPTELQFTAENPGAAQPIRFPLHTSRQTALTMVVPLGADHAVRIHNTAGTPGVFIDYAGYFSPDGVGTYTAVPGGTRLFDTHDAAAARHTPLGASEEFALQVRGNSGVPDNANAVAVNLTAEEATVPTTIAAYPQTYPASESSLFLNIGQKRSNLAIVRIGDDGKIRLRNSAGLTHVAVDLLGWFAPGDGAMYVPTLGAARVLDTRTGSGVPRASIGRGASVTAQVTGVGGVPTGATGVLVTGSAADKIVTTGVSFYAPETGWADAPALVADQGQTAPVTTLAPLGSGGKLTAANADGAVEMSADVTGYFVGGSPAAAAGNCVAPTDEPGFLSILDGRPETSLAKWGPTGAVQDGCEFGTPTGAGGPWNPSDMYDNDYTLRVDWKATGDNAQAGVSLGFSRTPGALSGIQVAIGGSSSAPTDATGAIKGAQAPLTSAAKPVGEWNTFEITLAGPKVTVLLNGTKVNEYTKPSGFERRTMMQLVSGSTGDEVKFRNLRVRSNRVSGSDLITGLGGSCLDLNGGVPTSSTVQTFSCNGSPAQQWTAGDLLLHVVGQCLDTQNASTAAGTRVLAVGCSGGATQEWQVFADGRIFNLASGRCLAASGSTNGSAVTIQDCNGQAQQIWGFTNRNAMADQLLNGVGSCLNVTNRVTADGAATAAAGCIQSLSDNWTFATGDTIRALGRCLDLKAGALTDGTQVVENACNGDLATQRWELRGDGTIVNPKAGKCLDATQGAASATIQSCTGSVSQTWTPERLYSHKGKMLGILGKCVDVNGNVDADGTAIQLFTCNISAAQQTTVQSDGTIRMKSRCLDATNGGTANNTTVQLFTCTGGSGQRWFQRPDGQVENPASGRCLSTLNGGDADGTRLVLFDCQYSPNQRWSVDFE